MDDTVSRVTVIPEDLHGGEDWPACGSTFGREPFEGRRTAVASGDLSRSGLDVMPGPCDYGSRPAYKASRLKLRPSTSSRAARAACEHLAVVAVGPAPGAPGGQGPRNGRRKVPGPRATPPRRRVAAAIARAARGDLTAARVGSRDADRKLRA